MVAIINGQNGKYAILSFTLLGLGMLSLIGFVIKSGYAPSLNYKGASLAFAKSPCLEVNMEKENQDG